ncbi:tail fiber assembly protein [Pseudoalteromonas luteoviolacea]|uniref:tail fiber assembly protein n=1 Tax=Pseudoalteromonas luteoviolacea TaxID=43657 RepID=UPI001151DB80|nr:tail fiber assembly protein [Pseudoalteromonas luteoviolacea]TQF71848.1 hypothetical protein FLM44_12505 [Pseudoalteromonas luteoviolacea]
MIVSLIHNGIQYTNFSAEALLAEGVPESVIDEAQHSQDWEEVRSKRNQLLTQCDWTQMADVGMSEVQKQDWLDYRQALRDIPTQASNPQEINWPAIPSGE